MCRRSQIFLTLLLSPFRVLVFVDDHHPPKRRTNACADKTDFASHATHSFVLVESCLAVHHALSTKLDRVDGGAVGKFGLDELVELGVVQSLARGARLGSSTESSSVVLAAVGRCRWLGDDGGAHRLFWIACFVVLLRVWRRCAFVDGIFKSEFACECAMFVMRNRETREDTTQRK